jgi:hypothetical protein
MDNERLSVRKFSQYVALGQLISVGLLILGFIFIIEKQSAILEVFGWFFILVGIIFIFTINRRKQRLLWIYKNTPPISMKMKLEKRVDSDSKNYFAYLTREDKNIQEGWKTGLYSPTFDIQLMVNSENQVQVYVDPKNNHPAVIKTIEGLLWVMGGSGAVQKLPITPEPMNSKENLKNNENPHA